MAMINNDLNLDDEELELEDPEGSHNDSEGQNEDFSQNHLEDNEPDEGSKDTNNLDNPEGDEGNNDEDILTTLLKSKGINPESIKVLNDKGETEELNFSSLTRDEQLEILNYKDDSDTSLDTEEISLINSLRGTGLSVNEYLEAIKRNAIQEYLNGNQVQTYDIDTYTDDELFILDKKARIPDLSDEDAQQALEYAKANKALFDKEIASLRSEYKQIEENKIKEQEEKERLEYEENIKAYEETITNALLENNEIDLGDSVLEFTEDDMQEIASFILDSDAAGIRYIQKALSDPKTLIQMSWFALKGQEVFSQISDYYKNQIKDVGLFNYKKGLEDGMKKAKSAQVVVNKDKKINKQPTTGIDFDDE